MRKLAILLMFATILTCPALAQPAAGSDDAKLQIAKSQHAIIEVLLQRREYSQVLPEFKKILALRLEGESERAVVKSAWIIAENLRKAQQYGTAEELVDATLAGAKQTRNRFDLLMLKGKIYQDQGRLQEAIQIYRKAQPLTPHEK